MGVLGWVLAALLGWTGIGVVGTAFAWLVGDRRRAWRSLGWIAGVWVVYLGVLLGVSATQRQKVLDIGKEECFGKVCLAVTGVTSVPQRGGWLVQVGVRVSNRGDEFGGVEGLEAYLVDGAGRRWSETRGVGGIPLTVRLPAGGVVVSEPVFRVDVDAEALRLVLTRGRSGWRWLVIGDSDSLWHKRTVLRLE